MPVYHLALRSWTAIPATARVSAARNLHSFERFPQGITQTPFPSRRFTSATQEYIKTALAATTMDSPEAFCAAFNADYEAKHYAFETQFWGNKMGLKSTDSVQYSTDLLASTKQAMEDLLSDAAKLDQAKTLRASLTAQNDATTKALDIIIRTMDCYIMPDAAKAIRQQTCVLESQLEASRNTLTLGYTDPSTSEFVAQSSVGLRNTIRTHPDEAVRKAAYQQGLESIGTFVLDNGFCEIVKLRNQLARLSGHDDYYDFKVVRAEGMTKKTLFEILDTLEQGTRPILQRAREQLAAKHGPTALEPWNTSFVMAGSVVTKLDPYFSFGKAVEMYLRSYRSLGIEYDGSEMNLDLLDRPGKYSNGFCHWPKPAWIKPDGTWQPAVTNFTSLADPKAVGSGYTALTTLMHEAGHAAHFANVKQPSPLFSQERAPTSVAYAETQSMFLDSLVSDAAWRAKYAKSVDGKVLPFEIHAEEIEATHPFQVFALRAMLVVSYFEKALYELPDDQVTPENVLALAKKMELEIQGGPSPRPLLSVPHLVSDEASCYYHGYTLAEMCVHQTRDFFLQRDGFIVDNPKVGPTLKNSYWQWGNSRPFLELVQELTGKPLTGDAWISALNENVEDKVRREQKEYDEALASPSPSAGEIDLNMTVRFVDGDTVIADSKSSGGLLAACSKFEAFVADHIAAKA